MSRLVSLYPAPWRSRYEDEFLAVLAARPLTVSDRFDIVRGAVDARLHPQVSGPQRVTDRYGIAPLAGFGLFVAAMWLAANGPQRSDEYGSYRDGGAALPFLVLAMVLLSVGLYRLVDRLPLEARWSRAAGWTAVVAGLLWSVAPWIMPIGVVFLLGVVGLAVGARRAGIVPAWSVVALALVSAIPVGLFAAMAFLPWYTMRLSGLHPMLVVVPLSLVWLVIGGLVLRGFPETGPETT